MKNVNLKPCPFCGKKPELQKYNETCDGRGDRYAVITCECQTQMRLSLSELKKAENDFGYTGGYYSDNKEFWNGMHNRLIEKWNNQNTSTDKEGVNKMVKKYKTKLCEIEAIQWNGLNLEEIKEFVGESLIYNICDTAWEVGKGRPHVDMKIKTLEGDMQASIGDYIIKGLRGEFYPCKPDVFEKKYELVKEK